MDQQGDPSVPNGRVVAARVGNGGRPEGRLSGGLGRGRPLPRSCVPDAQGIGGGRLRARRSGDRPRGPRVREHTPGRREGQRHGSRPLWPPVAPGALLSSGARSGGPLGVPHSDPRGHPAPLGARPKRGASRAAWVGEWSVAREPAGLRAAVGRVGAAPTNIARSAPQGAPQRPGRGMPAASMATWMSAQQSRLSPGLRSKYAGWYVGMT